MSCPDTVDLKSLPSEYIEGWGRHAHRPPIPCRQVLTKTQLVLKEATQQKPCKNQQSTRVHASKPWRGASKDVSPIFEPQEAHKNSPEPYPRHAWTRSETARSGKVLRFFWCAMRDHRVDV